MPRRAKTEAQQEEGSKALSRDVIASIENAVFSAKTIVNMAIYAVLEAPQELYFGSHSEKGLNVLEKVEIDTEVVEDGKTVPVRITKPYFSPTKQRGIERRAIAYSLVKTGDGKLVPYYKYFNLSIDVTNTYPNGYPNPRDILTFLWGATWTQPAAYIRGRVGYGGGVAIQGTFERKQRNRVEYNMYEITKKEGESEEETAQMLWMKEYAEPHLLIPVVRHGMLLGVDNYEPHAMAYAFLQGLQIAGAGTPKGIDILEAYWLSKNEKEKDEKEKVLVVDVGCWLLPDPVTISPVILSPVQALEEFKKKALKHPLFKESEPSKVFEEVKKGPAVRLVGNTAYEFLRKLANGFVENYLENIEKLSIPRVGALQAQTKQ